jgi:organic radical activating enzyme
MIKTTAITLSKPESMMVTWDIGRRCNYDCSYCESSRHDNVSSFHNFKELKETFNFIKSWSSIYNSHRSIPTEKTNINFTGGEPTLNPDFWKLISYINKNNQEFQLSLTTNGAWNKKYTKKIIGYFSGVTVSYHAEGHPKLKKLVIDNILELHKSNTWMQVNVMLHADHWDECVSVYNMLKQKGIKVNPRPIGDGNIIRKGWFLDSDGSMRKTSHTYSQLQQEWFWEQSGITQKSFQQTEGESLGRSCCGGRCLQGKVNDEWKLIKLVDTNFKDWYCSVDWYFLHVDQHTGLIYHHQTCQALHEKKTGSLGHLKDQEKIIEDLKVRLKNPSPIICPNQRCGCGMCVPKAMSLEDYKKITIHQ